MSAVPAAMCDQVLALPISGEAFLLRRRGHAVLVDGGWKKDNVTRVLATHLPAIKPLDIVVCTHGDGDHAGGLPDVLRHWPGGIGQVWLPGRWVGVVPELMKNPKGFVDQLIRELDTLIRENAPDPLVEAPFTRFEESTDPVPADISGLGQEAPPVRDADRADASDEVPAGGEDWDDPEIDLGTTEPTDDPPWFAELRGAKNLPIEKVADAAFQSARSRILYRKRKRRLSTAAATAWLGMVDTVEAIRRIAAAAIARRLRIRWFDYHAFASMRRPSGGVCGFLEPINAREQAPAPFKLSFLMRLTVINRQSLVFLAPPKLSRLGVLFCGDSPLGDGRRFAQSFLRHSRPPDLPIVATAPHHGAETNRAAYDHMRHWADVLVLLRAGGDRDQPGPTFKALDWPLKVCAACPGSGRPAHVAGVASPGRHPWFPLAIVGMPCGCA
ncbi:MBL fold metallo-hydrolase [Roseomonas mucosa]|uniref:Metallo-beta-lactamase superfamily n=1 Tax=Roseomonas mucosa TaxID=207340 RepID=A0A379PRE9_9PROT|nr:MULTISPECIES: MBL fold metallo-hydrolase [Roseomonas]MBS5905214.1 MBL fold metallo-hydrolase [Acetobacteraceae bacterium]MCG7353946.1 MBL fold metallo-hydrolase [Roseomonas mucosa]MDT8292098.1 MBL fold metallo-hydrolase [Roseomonas mucosa]MDT8296307.1 MBL fold metallo-hydrolase [Roseomonas mucosa]MDT8352475.1 MBL fold metallo-hydrolase [Roseomonas mucosa]